MQNALRVLDSTEASNADTANAVSPTQRGVAKLLDSLRTLADLTPSQHRLLDELSASLRPLTISELVERTGLHPNSLRETLNPLVEKQLVQRTPVRSPKRGRPSWLYEPSAPASLDLLATQIAELTAAMEVVLEKETGRSLVFADAIGRQWAEQVFAAQHLPRHSQIDPDAPGSRIERHVTKVRIFLSGMGFDARPTEHPLQLALFAVPVWDNNGIVNEFKLRLYSALLDQIILTVTHNRVGIALAPAADATNCTLTFVPTALQKVS